jgi:hypothetical protein
LLCQPVRHFREAGHFREPGHSGKVEDWPLDALLSRSWIVLACPFSLGPPLPPDCS